MAKRSRSTGRDDLNIANQRLPRVVRNPGPVYRLGPVVFKSQPMYSLLDIEDRRRWDPDPFVGARSLRGPRHRLTFTPSTYETRVSFFQKPYSVMKIAERVPYGISFRSPLKLAICIRRKMRREVLHALKKVRKTGFGSSRRTWASEISC